MVTGFLHDILAFKNNRSLVILFTLLSSLFTFVFPVYAAPWFTTYGGGVISGNSDNDIVKTTQPYFASGLVFKSALVQPGVIIPNPTMPSFAYGGIITRGSFDVKQTNSGGTTSPTNKDAFAKNIGALGSALPDYQRFMDVAVDVPGSCTCANILKSCNLSPVVYKAALNCINQALDALSSTNYNINSSGLVVLVQNDNPAGDFLKVNNKITSSAPDKRLALIMRNKIIIDSSVGTLAASQAGLISQDADIQAMLITTSTDDPSIEVQSGPTKSIKIEGPIISKGKVRFRRDAGSVWPGVFVQYNPFYATELAKLDASLSIFSSSSVRWSYE